MRSKSVRLNVTLPRDLVESLNQIAGPRNRSRMISESVREYIGQREKTEFENQLEEGYRASSPENIAVTKEFEAIDLEGWDEFAQRFQGQSGPDPHPRQEPADQTHWRP